MIIGVGFPIMDRSDIEALPYAIVGASIGVYRYYLLRPVVSWIEARISSEERLNRYIGSLANSEIDGLEPPKKE